MAELREKARDGYIAYLKASGERITDLLNMDDEALYKWYLIIKAQNDEMLRRREAAREKRR